MIDGNLLLKVIAIIPAYNEEDTISEVIHETREYVDEVIVIDDGSTDKTKKLAEDKGALVISQPVNRGYGEATRLGHRIALKRGADIIVQLDADGQYVPSEIPRLLEPIIKNEADVVFGSRFDGEIKYTMPLIKRWGNKAFSFLLRFLTRLPLSDGQTGFRAFRAQALQFIWTESSYTISQEMVLRIARQGWRFKEIPITFRKRVAGESRLIKHSLQYLRNAILIFVKIERDFHPLAFFGGFGACLSAAGAILGLYLLCLFAIAGKVSVMEHQLTLVLSIFLFASGLQMLFFGFMADMILSVKERLYHIANILERLENGSKFE